MPAEREDGEYRQLQTGDILIYFSIVIIYICVLKYIEETISLVTSPSVVGCDRLNSFYDHKEQNNQIERFQDIII